MMTRELSRQSPESSRRRHKERRELGELSRYQQVPVETGMQNEPQQDQRRHAPSSVASSLSSPSLSTDSSLLDISRESPKKFGLRSFFSRGSKRKHRHGAARKRPRRFLRFGNSSSSSVNSDLAYGKGYISDERLRQERTVKTPLNRRSRRHDAEVGKPPQPPKRSPTDDDETILELGRRFADIVKKQEYDGYRLSGSSRPPTKTPVRAAGALALSRFNRSTKPAHVDGSIGNSGRGHESIANDSEWESTSEYESTSSEDDVDLAYGPVAYASPRPSRWVVTTGLSEHSRLLEHEAIVQRQPPGVDRRRVELVDSLRGPVEKSRGPDKVSNTAVRDSIGPAHSASSKSPLLQYVYPVPTSDPSQFDVGRRSIVSDTQQALVSSRPAPVTLQQPQPIVPVPAKVFNPVEYEPGVRHRTSSANSFAGAAIAGIAGAAIAGILSPAKVGHDKYLGKRREDDDQCRPKQVESKRSDTAEGRSDDREGRRAERRREKKRLDSKGDYEARKPRDRHRHDADDYEGRTRDRPDFKPREDGHGDGERTHKHGGGEKQKRPDEYSEIQEPKAQPSTGPVDIFQFQVADDAWPSPKYATAQRPLTPMIVTVDREPDFARLESRADGGSHLRRLSRKESYEREVRSAEHVYDRTQQATAPVNSAADASAFAALATEEHRSRDRSPGSDSGSRRRSPRKVSRRDVVLDDADRYYREQAVARKLASESIRRVAPVSSVVDKWREDFNDEQEWRPALEVVTPPEKAHAAPKGPYDAPNADVRIDNEMEPEELLRYHSGATQLSSRGIGGMAPFRSRERSTERRRPVLNLVRPTPASTPPPEKQEARGITCSDLRGRAGNLIAQAADQEGATCEAISAATPKLVTWGEDETKHYAVGGPVREGSKSAAKVVIPAESSKKRSSGVGRTWDTIAGAVMAAGAVVASMSNDKDATRSGRSRKTSTSSEESTKYQSSDPKDDHRHDEPPVPGPKPSSPGKQHVPGAFDEDPEFTATMAAALQDTGFDPNIVLDDPKYYRRDSPAAATASPAVYRSPYAETVSDLSVSGEAARPSSTASSEWWPTTATTGPTHALWSDTHAALPEEPAASSSTSRSDRPPQDPASSGLPIDEAGIAVIADEGQRTADAVLDSDSEKQERHDKTGETEHHDAHQLEDAEADHGDDSEVLVPVDAFVDVQDAGSETKSNRAPDTSGLASVPGSWAANERETRDEFAGTMVGDTDEKSWTPTRSQERSDFEGNTDDTSARRPLPSRDFDAMATPGSVGVSEDLASQDSAASEGQSKSADEGSAPVTSKKSKGKAKTLESPRGSKMGTPRQSITSVGDQDETGSRHEDAKYGTSQGSAGPGLFDGLDLSTGMDDDKEFSSGDGRDDTEHSFLGNAGTLGVGVGLAAAVAASTARDDDCTAEPPSKVKTVEDSDVIDPDISRREIRPAIDPQYGDFLPLPPNTATRGAPASEAGQLPSLPESRPQTPEEQERQLRRELMDQPLHQRRRGGQSSATKIKTVSHSAIPLQFRLKQRSTPSSPASLKSPPPASLKSPLPASGSSAAHFSEPSSASKSRSSRPTTWDSTKDFMPLYLVEKTARKDSQEGEQLPVLPSSGPPSRRSPGRGHESEAEEDVPHRGHARRIAGHLKLDIPPAQVDYEAEGHDSSAATVKAVLGQHATSDLSPKGGPANVEPSSKSVVADLKSEHRAYQSALPPSTAVLARSDVTEESESRQVAKQGVPESSIWSALVGAAASGLAATGLVHAAGQRTSDESTTIRPNTEDVDVEDGLKPREESHSPEVPDGGSLASATEKAPQAQEDSFTADDDVRTGHVQPRTVAETITVASQAEPEPTLPAMPDSPGASEGNTSLQYGSVSDKAELMLPPVPDRPTTVNERSAWSPDEPESTLPPLPGISPDMEASTVGHDVFVTPPESPEFMLRPTPFGHGGTEVKTPREERAVSPLEEPVYVFPPLPESPLSTERSTPTQDMSAPSLQEPESALPPLLDDPGYTPRQYPAVLSLEEVGSTFPPLPDSPLDLDTGSRTGLWDAHDDSTGYRPDDVRLTLPPLLGSPGPTDNETAQYASSSPAESEITLPVLPDSPLDLDTVSRTELWDAQEESSGHSPDDVGLTLAPSPGSPGATGGDAARQEASFSPAEPETNLPPLPDSPVDLNTGSSAELVDSHEGSSGYSPDDAGIALPPLPDSPGTAGSDTALEEASFSPAEPEITLPPLPDCPVESETGGQRGAGDVSHSAPEEVENKLPPPLPNSGTVTDAGLRISSGELTLPSQPGSPAPAETDGSGHGVSASLSKDELVLTPSPVPVPVPDRASSGGEAITPEDVQDAPLALPEETGFMLPPLPESPANTIFGAQLEAGDMPSTTINDPIGNAWPPLLVSSEATEMDSTRLHESMKVGDGDVQVSTSLTEPPISGLGESEISLALLPYGSGGPIQADTRVQDHGRVEQRTVSPFSNAQVGRLEETEGSLPALHESPMEEAQLEEGSHLGADLVQDNPPLPYPDLDPACFVEVSDSPHQEASRSWPPLPDSLADTETETEAMSPSTSTRPITPAGPGSTHDEELSMSPDTGPEAGGLQSSIRNFLPATLLSVADAAGALLGLDEAGDKKSTQSVGEDKPMSNPVASASAEAVGTLTDKLPADTSDVTGVVDVQAEEGPGLGKGDMAGAGRYGITDRTEVATDIAAVVGFVPAEESMGVMGAHARPVPAHALTEPIESRFDSQGSPDSGLASEPAELDILARQEEPGMSGGGVTVQGSDRTDGYPFEVHKLRGDDNSLALDKHDTDTAAESNSALAVAQSTNSRSIGDEDLIETMVAPSDVVQGLDPIERVTVELSEASQPMSSGPPDQQQEFPRSGPVIQHPEAGIAGKMSDEEEKKHHIHGGSDMSGPDISGLSGIQTAVVHVEHSMTMSPEEEEVQGPDAVPLTSAAIETAVKNADVEDQQVRSDGQTALSVTEAQKGAETEEEEAQKSAPPGASPQQHQSTEHAGPGDQALEGSPSPEERHGVPQDASVPCRGRVSDSWADQASDAPSPTENADPVARHDEEPTGLAGEDLPVALSTALPHLLPGKDAPLDAADAEPVFTEHSLASEQSPFTNVDVAGSQTRLEGGEGMGFGTADIEPAVTEQSPPPDLAQPEARLEGDGVVLDTAHTEPVVTEHAHVSVSEQSPSDVAEQEVQLAGEGVGLDTADAEPVFTEQGLVLEQSPAPDVAGSETRLEGEDEVLDMADAEPGALLGDQGVGLDTADTEPAVTEPVVTEPAFTGHGPVSEQSPSPDGTKTEDRLEGEDEVLDTADAEPEALLEGESVGLDMADTEPVIAEHVSVSEPSPSPDMAEPETQLKGEGAGYVSSHSVPTVESDPPIGGAAHGADESTLRLTGDTAARSGMLTGELIDSADVARARQGDICETGHETKSLADDYGKDDFGMESAQMEAVFATPLEPTAEGFFSSPPDVASSSMETDKDVDAEPLNMPPAHEGGGDLCLQVQTDDPSAAESHMDREPTTPTLPSQTLSPQGDDVEAFFTPLAIANDRRSMFEEIHDLSAPPSSEKVEHSQVHAPDTFDRSGEEEVSAGDGISQPDSQTSSGSRSGSGTQREALTDMATDPYADNDRAGCPGGTVPQEDLSPKSPVKNKKSKGEKRKKGKKQPRDSLELIKDPSSPGHVMPLGYAVLTGTTATSSEPLPTGKIYETAAEGGHSAKPPRLDELGSKLSASPLHSPNSPIATPKSTPESAMEEWSRAMHVQSEERSEERAKGKHQGDKKTEPSPPAVAEPALEASPSSPHEAARLAGPGSCIGSCHSGKEELDLASGQAPMSAPPGTAPSTCPRIDLDLSPRQLSSHFEYGRPPFPDHTDAPEPSSVTDAAASSHRRAFSYRDSLLAPSDDDDLPATTERSAPISREQTVSPREVAASYVGSPLRPLSRSPSPGTPTAIRSNRSPSPRALSADLADTRAGKTRERAKLFEEQGKISDVTGDSDLSDAGVRATAVLTTSGGVAMLAQKFGGSKKAKDRGSGEESQAEVRESGPPAQRGPSPLANAEARSDVDMATCQDRMEMAREDADNAPHYAAGDEAYRDTYHPTIPATRSYTPDFGRMSSRSLPPVEEEGLEDSQGRRSASNSSIGRLLITEGVRGRSNSPNASLLSLGSIRSVTHSAGAKPTPPLRRADRRISGDVRWHLSDQLSATGSIIGGRQADESDAVGPEGRAVTPLDSSSAKQAKVPLPHGSKHASPSSSLVQARESSPAPSRTASAQSTTTPVANEGRVRIKEKDMTDVYDGLGEGRIGSPRSPTRPHSMRRRQSMQVLELEARLQQLLADNRALAEDKLQLQTRVSLQSNATAALADRDVELEELKANLLSLRNEVNRLVEVNDGLNSANNQLARQHNERYRQLELQYASSARELELSQGTRGHYDKTLQEREADIRRLQSELELSKEQVRALQAQILAAKAYETDFLQLKAVDYFNFRLSQVYGRVEKWVLRFSKISDMRACRLIGDIRDDKIIDRLENAVLDGSDVDNYLRDRVRRRDILMSITMNMIWELVFTRYLFGLDREQRQKLKQLERHLSEVGPAHAVRQWRAVTLTLLSRRPAFAEHRGQDTEAVAQAIVQTLSTMLPPPTGQEEDILAQFRRVLRDVVDLSVEMRLQRAEYMMLPPLEPRCNADGDLVTTVAFDARLMNERSSAAGEQGKNDEYERQAAVVRTVLFPLVVRKGDEDGVGDDEVVVHQAQVLVARKAGRLLTPASEMAASRGASPSALGRSVVSLPFSPLSMPLPLQSPQQANQQAQRQEHQQAHQQP